MYSKNVNWVSGGPPLSALEPTPDVLEGWLERAIIASSGPSTCSITLVMSRPRWPTDEEDFRIRAGLAVDRHSCYATGDCEWSSGDSRFNRRFRIQFFRASEEQAID